ncbi:MAG: tetratricopeptide repeat protein [Cyclobacteriaceae bacterium]
MRGLFIFVFTSVIFDCAAQDSLFSFNQLKYRSDFEKKAFHDYFKLNDRKALPLLLAATSSMTQQKYKDVDSRINSIVESLRREELDKKKPDKKIKIVYEEVHKGLLKKYELENRFYEIFQTGNYNCVTATAAYAIVFDQLGIPYQIKEEPTHVYLISYPEKENILVETTTPLFGYVTFSDEFKSKYVSNLKKQKVIGQDELESSSSDQLFNKYYFKKEKITLTELIGIHYMNDALFLKDHDQWREGYNQLEKAYLFYPSSRCKYLLMLFGSQIVSKEKLSPIEKSEYTAKASHFKEEGITTEMIQGEFINLTHDLLFRENNKTLYQECYNIYCKGITDKDLLKEINFIYKYESGRAYYNVGDYVKAKPFFSEALELQPNNIDLGGVFVNLIAFSLRKVTDEASVLDTLNKYKTKYPSLSQFVNFNAMLANANLIRFGSSYENGKPELAKNFKDAFDSILKQFPNSTIDDNIVAKAFGSVSTYYFRRGQKAKAREALQEGLKLSPDNYQLRIRLQMIR